MEVGSGGGGSYGSGQVPMNLIKNRLAGKLNDEISVFLIC
jgi:hypothetical protein